MPLAWTVRREGELSPADHAAMLASADPQYPGKFTGTRSWLGARPEARVVGRDADGGVAAHAGVVRRFVQAGGSDQLVGLVGVV